IEMIAGFAQATRVIATLTQAIEREEDQVEMDRILVLRNRVSGLFTSINAQSDAVPFESGPLRLSHLVARERIRRWLSTLRSIYILELPLFRRTLNAAPDVIPVRFQGGDGRFYEAIGASLDHIADCLERQLEGTEYEHPGPKRLIDASAERGLHKFPVASKQ